jgi:hypothetical protein
LRGGNKKYQVGDDIEKLRWYDEKEIPREL